MTSPFLCQMLLSDLEKEFGDSVGLDDIAYQKAALFYSEEIVGLDKTFMDL